MEYEELTLKEMFVSIYTVLVLYNTFSPPPPSSIYFWATIPITQLATFATAFVASALTLNIRNTLLQDLVQNLGVLQLLLDLGNDSIGELLLLASLDLALVADPRVEHILRLGGDRGLLLKLIGLSFELSGFLPSTVSAIELPS